MLLPLLAINLSHTLPHPVTGGACAPMTCCCCQESGPHTPLHWLALSHTLSHTCAEQHAYSTPSHTLSHRLSMSPQPFSTRHASATGQQLTASHTPLHPPHTPSHALTHHHTQVEHEPAALQHSPCLCHRPAAAGSRPPQPQQPVEHHVQPGT
jgi:hypothetical protein